MVAQTPSLEEKDVFQCSGYPLVNWVPCGIFIGLGEARAVAGLMLRYPIFPPSV